MGASYGEAPPSDLGFSFQSAANGGEKCSVTAGISPYVDNILSAFTASEWLRRLVLHREVPPEHRTPNVQYVVPLRLALAARWSHLHGWLVTPTRLSCLTAAWTRPAGW